jgi:flotillin
VISGVGKAGFRFLSGGRAFPIPLLNTFDRMDLTPHTIEVKVESAIAAKIVPLNVTATVSFAIANNETGRRRALTRILAMAKDSRRLISVATNIIEGHLRDSISSLTPEQVMSDKDTLVAKMINACKSDLENIGLFITTMNIADVDDNRLDGVDEPEMYIALLKRVKTVQAETTARKAMADSHAQAAMERERRLAEVQVTELENQLEQLKAETELLVATEKQKEIVGVKDASEKARSDVAGYTERLIAEKANIGRLRTQYEAEIITPALAQKEKMILNARAESDQYLATAQAEIDQLKETLRIVAASGQAGVDTFMIEHFADLITPFADTMAAFPVDSLSVISGAEGSHEPIGPFHPHALALGKNDLLANAIASATGGKAPGTVSVPAAVPGSEPTTSSNPNTSG